MYVDNTKAVTELLGKVRSLSARLPAAEEYVMVHHPAFRVGKKPFVIVGMEQDKKGATLTVNLGREAQDMLLDDPRFTRTPYIGQHGWVTVAHAALKKGELELLITDSFRRIANKAQLAALDGAKAEPAATAKKPGSSGRKRA